MTKTSSRAEQVEWETRISFRNRLREGRTKALADAEDFVNIVQTLEELGQVLCGEHRSGLGKYERELQAFVVDSALAHDPARKAPDLHVPIDRLLRVVREGRNDAVHIGSFARKVVSHAIDLALIVEDAMVPEGTVRFPSTGYRHCRILAAIKFHTTANAGIFLFTPARL
jgi:hypothetical protein